jgi:dTDP-4-dehydrorhamnose reductase
MITLIGHGYIGQEIYKRMEVQSYFPIEWIDHKSKIPSGTQLIINAAGFTGSPNVDACEKYREETIDGNVYWPLKLELENHQTPIIHISSGCVYTGYEKEYTEEDEPNFNFNNGSFYSGSKSLGQKLLSPFMNKSYLLRIRMPFGSLRHPKNFLTKLENYNKLVDFRNSLSNVDDISKTVEFFAINKPTPGIYNLVNPGSITTREIVDMMGLSKEWFTHEEFASAVIAPRSNCVLSSEKLSNIISLRSIDDALTHTIQEYNNV